MIPFRKSCREATALLVAREDRALSMGERIALRLHLVACAACPRFERQTRFDLARLAKLTCRIVTANCT